MDDITRRVSEMYARFPYPSPRVRDHTLTELVNLLTIFSLEAGYDFAGKHILDAGTGTGHRLVAAAAAFAQARFTAVDVSDAPLAVARQVAAHEGVRNVEFRVADVMDGVTTLGPFDMILSMGVIHHLSDPAAGVRHLVRRLADDGILFLYLYGRHGSQERMRRKQIVSLLQGRDARDFDTGIRLAKALGFDSFDYGWNLQAGDDDSRNALIVDAYLNVNERLFDFDDLVELLEPSGLHGFLIYGITAEKYGRLVDTRETNGASTLPVTDIGAHLQSPMVREAYARLTLPDRYRLIDLLFRPNGYTVLGFKGNALRGLGADSRLLANAITVGDG